MNIYTNEARREIKEKGEINIHSVMKQKCKNYRLDTKIIFWRIKQQKEENVLIDFKKKEKVWN